MFENNENKDNMNILDFNNYHNNTNDLNTNISQNLNTDNFKAQDINNETITNIDIEEPQNLNVDSFNGGTNLNTNNFQTQNITSDSPFNVNVEQSQNLNQNNIQIDNTFNIDQPMASENQDPIPVLNIDNDYNHEENDNVFGVPISTEQPDLTTDKQNSSQQINLDMSSKEEKPKYGYSSNEKANLDADENSSIKFIIFLAILMLIVIILLPYLSSLL